MIAIASHNGHKYLPRLLFQLRHIDLQGHAVVIVDTGSSEPEAHHYLDKLKEEKWPFPLYIERLPYIGYDSGAYQWVAQKYIDQEYLFMHDTMVIRDPNFGDKFFKIPQKTIKAFLTFPLAFDTLEQQSWVTKFIPLDFLNRPNRPMQLEGIFGPIFSCSYEFLKECQGNGYLKEHPSNKMQACGMERGWAIAAYNLGYQIQSVDGQVVHNPALYYSFNTLLKVS